MSSQCNPQGSLAGTKSELRKKMREVRGQLCPYYRQDQSQQIVDRLTTLLDAAKPLRVGMYLATAYEVNLDVLIGLRHGKGEEIYLPHIADHQNPFLRFDSWDSLEEGPLGLRQLPESAPSLGGAVLDAIILPGLAFDPFGNRLGQGGGWYDRVLSKGLADNFQVIGVCFDEQLVESVPYGQFDVRMDIVVTASSVWPDAKAIRQ